MKLRSLPFAVLLIALALAGCGSKSKTKAVSPGGGSAASGAASGGSLTVKETDFKLDPTNLDVKDPGAVTITVKNDGQTTHALEVEGQGLEKKTSGIAPGATATLTVTLKKGTYEWYCPIDGHKKLGMKGTIKVGGQTSNPPTITSGGSGSTTTSSGSSNGY